MARLESRQDRDKKLVESLNSLAENKFEVWKYFEDRADRLGEQLWLIGTWLMAVAAATLSLPFVARFIEVSEDGFPFKIKFRAPVILIAVFGLAFCGYGYAALTDLRKHLEGNWRRASLAREGKWSEAGWSGRKRHGWNVLIGIGVLQVAAFLFLLVLACLP